MQELFVLSDHRYLGATEPERFEPRRKRLHRPRGVWVSSPHSCTVPPRKPINAILQGDLGKKPR